MVGPPLHILCITHPSPCRRVAQPNGKSRSRRPSAHGRALATSDTPEVNPHIPLPPPDTHLYDKSPGHTRKSLEDIERLGKFDKLTMNGVAPHLKHNSSSTTGSITPSSSESPSASECESWSVPSTQPPSRAPSMSAGVSGGKITAPVKQPTSKVAPKKELPPPTAPRISPTLSAGDEKSSRKGPPSVHSDSGGQKFTLKDLLGAPKLVRRSSARSNASSKKSNSDRDGRSDAGSTVSLLKKYGVCEKVAIGKGATSVVRLAHKWDRSEEKLYAVKVRLHIGSRRA